MSFKKEKLITNKTVGSSRIYEFEASGNYFHREDFGGCIKKKIDPLFDRQKASKVQVDTMMAVFPTLLRLTLLYLTLAMDFEGAIVILDHT